MKQHRLFIWAVIAGFCLAYFVVSMAHAQRMPDGTQDPGAIPEQERRAAMADQAWREVLTMDDLEFRIEWDRLTRIYSNPMSSQEEVNEANKKMNEMLCHKLNGTLDKYEGK